ncbi:uncharacterized protein TRIADDRAFT_52277 [Trichoplax adhaerens]|uniref:Uncharacterized protein n=1 Tax=Trichoplax adhaerens TaxID=10228 RepID=B3RM90_TRIAD|nr:predicted protein [Trichoplax adhaerens]EDV29656.1 predicted protein [Trichoplax adhaerens]|eukprot:XP_002108858.1 predicted protein [Trichoplax adhaerens]
MLLQNNPVCETKGESSHEKDNQFELLPHSYWPSGVIHSPNPDQYNCIWKISYQHGPMALIINKFAGDDDASIIVRERDSFHYQVSGLQLKSNHRSEFVNWAVPLTPRKTSGEIEILYPTNVYSPLAHFEMQFGPVFEQQCSNGLVIRSASGRFRKAPSNNHDLEFCLWKFQSVPGSALVFVFNTSYFKMCDGNIITYGTGLVPGKNQVGRLRTAEKIVNNITLLSSTAWFMILPAYRDRTVRNSYFEISWYSAPISAITWFVRCKRSGFRRSQRTRRRTNGNRRDTRRRERNQPPPNYDDYIKSPEYRQPNNQAQESIRQPPTYIQALAMYSRNKDGSVMPEREQIERVRTAIETTI